MMSGAPHALARLRPGLLQGEELHGEAGRETLAYFRPGLGAGPLMVFLPGGGHLGRISYGHPGANATDFLDHWLGERGFGLLALSCPNDALSDSVDATLSSREWAVIAVGIVDKYLQDFGLPRRVVVLGWSMAGKLVPTFTRTAAERGIAVELFVSLSAMPPLPGLANFTPGGESLTAKGLWQVDSPIPGGRTRHALWREDLARQRQAAGAPIIDDDSYARYYLCDIPLNLRGEIHRFRDGRVVEDAAAALADVAVFDYPAYPVAAVIAPEGAVDPAHALTAAPLWAAFTTRSAYEFLVAGVGGAAALASLDAETWAEIRRLFAAMPAQLSRTLPGGHFFFLGAPGARETARLVEELLTVATSIRERLIAIADRASGRALSSGAAPCGERRDPG